MKICIIPARGGSKRLPRKNIKNFCGRPIISYSVEVAEVSGLFDHIIVSTDDHEIAATAQKYGAEVPFVRPQEISDDFASTLDVMAHSVQWCLNNISKEIDQFCCLYATAPFTSSKQLAEASGLLKENIEYVFSATEFSYNIFRSFRINKAGRCEMFWPENFNKRSQDLEKAYHDAGMFYFGTPQAFINKLKIFSNYSAPYLLPHYFVQDIDTEDDWIRAEKLYKILTE